MEGKMEEKRVVSEGGRSRARPSSVTPVVVVVVVVVVAVVH